MSCEGQPAPLAERLTAQKREQAETMDEAYTWAGTQVTRGVRLVSVLELDNRNSVLDNPDSAAAGAAAWVSTTGRIHWPKPAGVALGDMSPGVSRFELSQEAWKGLGQVLAGG